MNRLILAASAFVALTLGAEAADPTYFASPQRALTGDIALHGGFGRVQAESFDDETGVLFGGLARAHYIFMPGWSVQFDINGESFYNGAENHDAVFNIAGHLSYRTQSFLIGGMLSKGFNAFGNENLVTLALEGQYYLGNIVLYGQGGYTSVWGGDAHAWYIHKELRFFLNPNLMVSGDAGLVAASYGSDTARAVRVGAGIEKRFAAGPFGAFARFEGAWGDYYGSTGSEGVVKIGFKGYFHAQTLLAATYGGVTLVDFNPCTGINFIRMACSIGVR